MIIYSRYNQPREFLLSGDECQVLFEAEYCRYGMFPDGDGREGVSFVDPPGGPFMSVGGFLSSFSANLPRREIVKIKAFQGGATLFLKKS